MSDVEFCDAHAMFLIVVLYVVYYSKRQRPSSHDQKVNKFGLWSVGECLYNVIFCYFNVNCCLINVSCGCMFKPSCDSVQASFMLRCRATERSPTWDVFATDGQVFPNLLTPSWPPTVTSSSLRFDWIDTSNYHCITNSIPAIIVWQL